MISPDPIETPSPRHASISSTKFEAASRQTSFPRSFVLWTLTTLLAAIGCGDKQTDRVAPEHPTDIAGSSSASESSALSAADSEEGPEPVLGEDGP
ncbi:MAG TPA: hypothetical protein PLI18_10935 [Pirellulaceae bacterium]|nr:hypothetical protein [Pirellulaceae bacterium]